MCQQRRFRYSLYSKKDQRDFFFLVEGVKLAYRLYCCMKKTILLATVLLGAVTVSQAGIRVGLGFTVPLTPSPPPVVVSQPPVVYQAPAAVCQAPPLYQAPAPVYQAPPPAVVYTPPPAVVYAPPPPVVYAPPVPSIYLGFGSFWGGHYGHYGHYAPYRGHWGGWGHGRGWHR